MKKYKFFWGGIYSNWYKKDFVIDVFAQRTRFNCVEQYMMYCKAVLMGDAEMAEKIMGTPDPRQQKEFGRKIKNYKAEIWDTERFDLVYKGVLAKFEQNPELKAQMMAEDADLFVEASPHDKIWGIGLDIIDASNTPEHQWPGENLLGKVVTKVRNTFKMDEDANRSTK